MVYLVECLWSIHAAPGSTPGKDGDNESLLL